MLPDAVAEAEAILEDDEATLHRMKRVTDLIEGYEDPYGLELLSSVHWVMREQPDARAPVAAAIAAVHNWNPRKRQTLKKEHLVKAWQRLKEQGW